MSHNYRDRIVCDSDLITHLLRATERNLIGPRESGAASGSGSCVHHGHVPPQLARELHERNGVVTAAEDDERNGWLQYFQQYFNVARRQLIRLNCGSTCPQRVPGILFEPGRKLTISDV